MEIVAGIDLGTTNSEISCIFEDTVEIITQNDDGIVPSCVGVNSAGELVVGREAKNQAAVAPDNTIMSIKRLMGTDTVVTLGGNEYSPQEISAFILKTLKERAESRTGRAINKAVITVPAYFTDSQRKATRDAGSIAGLEVVRIINEPTAAALAYEQNTDQGKTILVYDLGGGTFDVSIVKIENSVVEVLSSTGDNHLGGDDFDAKLADLFASMINEEHSLTINDNNVAMARLLNEAEKAKIALTSEPYVQVDIDHIAEKKGKPVHFSYSLSREEFETLIMEDIENTMNSVNKALEDASLLPSAIDRIVLVGGSTRMPVVAAMLYEKFNMEPHGEVDPDLCVCTGAGVQAGREMGLETSAMLIDITPYTFGTSAFGLLDGEPTPSMYVPIIRRNSKLPVSKSEVFFTMVEHQEAVDVNIYQGENKDADKNLVIGNYHFKLSGKSPANSAITMKYDLDINGILKIEAVEKRSGNKLEVTIDNAFAASSEETIRESQEKLGDVWGEPVTGTVPGNDSQLSKEIQDIVDLANSKLEDAPADDKDEIINLIEDIKTSMDGNNLEQAEALSQELDDILFYID